MTQSSPRGIFSSDASDCESRVEAATSPYACRTPSGLRGESVSDAARYFLRQGSCVQQLVDECPEDVVPLLKEHAVVQLGIFQVTDSEMLRAFGKQKMLTRGSDSLIEREWKENWLRRLQNPKNRQLSTVSVGWEEKVWLGAYAVNIKYIASRHQGALLKLLLQKSSAGATTKKIWEYPAVRAVINYHWQHWAWRFLIASCVIFMCWLLCFTLYVILYISAQETGPFWENGYGTKHLPRILNIGSFAFMCPFAVAEYWTIAEQKWRWIQSRNIVDICAIFMQILLFICHLLKWPVTAEWFSMMLAFQCVILFTKLQNFGRSLGVGASFSEILAYVMYDVRYLLIYMSLTGFSAALCLGALYKHDVGFKERSSKNTHFSSFRNSLVSTIQIVFGGFESAYIFDADYPWVKICFFFGFRILMSITVLNLIIAVMTQSYAKFDADHIVRYNSSRASIIEELDVLRFPRLFAGELDPYIHFLIEEKNPKGVPDQNLVLRQNLASNDELLRKMDDMSVKLAMLYELVESEFRRNRIPVNNLAHIDLMVRDPNCHRGDNELGRTQGNSSLRLKTLGDQDCPIVGQRFI